MKTQISLAVVAALLMPVASNAANCNGGCSNGGKTIKTYTTIKYDNGYSQPNNYVAYTPYKPAKRAELYNGFGDTEKVSLKSKNYIKTEKRKYYLAHPFFQPLKGKFGSVSDLSYNYNGYDIDFSGVGQLVYLSDGSQYGNAFLAGNSAKWKSDTFSIKEDLSFGITDRVALLGMLRYDSVDSKFDWSNGTKDSYSDNDVNLFGFGLQGRFVDTDEWIATGSFYYEHQKDVSDDFILELKAGYKTNRSTIYGIGRLWFVDFDGNAYGNYISGKDDAGYNSELFLAYKSDISSAVYGEIGIGDFTVLAEDWTFNIEGLFGHYDWHNQLSAKLAFGWQPNDWFALNLYGRAAFYDDAEDKTLDAFYKRDNVFLDAEHKQPIDDWFSVGNAGLKKYSEYSLGLQAVFMF